MRKYSFIMMAFVLLIGMAQCKKEPTTPNGDNNGGVRITLKVNDGESGEKLNVYPATGAVIFTQGDKIYVGNNGKYVGTLTFDNGLFQGTVSGDLSTNDYLHFYFVGNKPTSPSTLAAGPPPIRSTSATNPLDCRPFRMRPPQRNTHQVPRPILPSCSIKVPW